MTKGRNSKFRRAISLALALIMGLSVMLTAQFTASAAGPSGVFPRTPELKVMGNKVVWADDEAVEVLLMGVDPYENNYQNITNRNRIVGLVAAAYDEWNSNCVRLNVEINSNKWNNAYYKDSVDLCVKEAEKRGKYIIIDLHEFGYISEQAKNFWLEVAAKYANNPAVLFGLLNEPHDMSWDVWRNGGIYSFEASSPYTYGHQEILEMIRDLGARNICVVGGLDWSYDLRGIVGQALLAEDMMPGKVLEWGEPGVVYALTDQGTGGDLSKAGNGVIYETHIYPWKGWDEWDKDVKLDPGLRVIDRCIQDWNTKVPAQLRESHPVNLGESGWGTGVIRDIMQYVNRNGMTVTEAMNTYYQPGQELYHDKWVPALYEWLNTFYNGAQIHHTAWCFHNSSAPALITNYTQYAPNDYWGIYVKNDLELRLGENLLFGKNIIDASNMATAPLAIDGLKNTAWTCDDEGDKYLIVDLGGVYKIGKWGVRHSSSTVPGYFAIDPLITSDFELQASMDGGNWVTVDAVSDNLAPVTQRLVKPFIAQFIKLNVTKPAAAGDALMIYDFFVSKAVSAPNTVVLSGPAVVTNEAGSTATYTISVENMQKISGIELEFTVDGRFLSAKDFTTNGFSFFGEGNHGTPIYWRNEGDKWIGKITLLSLSDGAEGDMDVLEMVYNVTEGALGDADVTLNYLRMSFWGDEADVYYKNDLVNTSFVQWYSRYDLNKYGVVDLNDLTYALQYLMVEEGDPLWDAAKVADFDGNKIVDISDLLLILANYTIPYYG